MLTQQIILASASPRRRELLEQIGVSYRVKAVDIDETPLLNELPLAYVERIAAEKSAACHNVVDVVDIPVLAADTAVVLNGQIMGKPHDFEHACKMLQALSGSTHLVYSAVSLRTGQHRQAVSITEVAFRNLSNREITAYWQTGEPLDKAGAYAIQGAASIFVESIKGSFSGVMGLPLFETAQLLEQQGINIIT